MSAPSTLPEHWGISRSSNPSKWLWPMYRTDGVPVGAWVRRAVAALAGDDLSRQDTKSLRDRAVTAWKMLWPDVPMPSKLVTKADSFDPDPDVPHDGVMIAFGLDEQVAQVLAVDGGEPVTDMHVTVAYLGDVATFTDADLATVGAALRRFAIDQAPITGGINGAGIWRTDPAADLGAGTGVAFAQIDLPGLTDLRARLIDVLHRYGIAVFGDHDFHPHITVAHGLVEDLAQLPVPPRMPLTFTTVMLVAGGQVVTVPLEGHLTPPPPVDVTMSATVADEAGPVLKSDPARMYTLAPLYVPGVDDTHAEYVTADDLEDGVVDYMDAGDFTINLQHTPGTKAGRCVGVIVWPFEVTCDLTVPGEVSRQVTIPAGAVYQAVKWEAWAWEQARTGRIRGLSLEGRAAKIGETT